MVFAKVKAYARLDKLMLTEPIFCIFVCPHDGEKNISLEPEHAAKADDCGYEQPKKRRNVTHEGQPVILGHLPDKRPSFMTVND